VEKEDDTAPKQETTMPEPPNVTPLSRDNQVASLPTAPNEEDDEESSTKPTRSPPPKPAKALSKQAPSQWHWPHKGRIIGRFGQFGARHNTGIDIAANMGDSIYAAADGVVAYADQGVTGYGNMILLRHGGSFMTAYAHLDKILVKRGQNVRLGDTIALSGQTGITTSPRLHFEIRQSITPLNPLQYLPKRY
jgi:lipoprotein NlpD